MKAVDWAKKFQEATDVNAVMEEYGKETAELVAARSKTSSDKTKLSTMDSAVNEQRTKFRAIVSRVPALRMELFEGLLDKFTTDYLLIKKKAAEKPPETEKKETTDAGRKLAKNLK